MATTSTGTSLRVGGTISVAGVSTVVVTLAEAQSTTDYRVAVRVIGQPIQAWTTNHTTTTFEVQLSASLSGDIFYEVTS